jgi:quinol monooxygenase YgiN
MWAQLITMRVKDGRAADVAALLEHLRSIEQADSGWIRSTALSDQADPNRVLLLAVFESEERARARESDPRRDEGLAQLRTMMADVLDAPPEFTDLTVVAETTP